MLAAYVQEPASGADARYQALIRLAEAIRSQPDPEDLFETLARQLHELGVSFFLPLIPKRLRIRGKVVASHLPLFGGYLFQHGPNLRGTR